jgi:hypothetical protein
VFQPGERRDETNEEREFRLHGRPMQR